jgi:ferritin
MLSERLATALNDQVARELAAAHQYFAVGAHYEADTFPRLAEFFYDQADEERSHAMKMVRYLIDKDAPVQLGSIDAPNRGFADHVEPIKLALDQERNNTVKISELVEIARDTRDHASEQFMQWFVAEQVEEEATMQALLAVAERTRDIPMLLEEYLAREMPGR